MFFNFCLFVVYCLRILFLVGLVVLYWLWVCNFVEQGEEGFGGLCGGFSFVLVFDFVQFGCDVWQEIWFIVFVVMWYWCEIWIIGFYDYLVIWYDIFEYGVDIIGFFECDDVGCCEIGIEFCCLFCQFWIVGIVMYQWVKCFFFYFFFEDVVYQFIGFVCMDDEW